jgi:hypothetical protein
MNNYIFMMIIAYFFKPAKKPYSDKFERLRQKMLSMALQLYKKCPLAFSSGHVFLCASAWPFFWAICENFEACFGSLADESWAVGMFSAGYGSLAVGEFSAGLFFVAEGSSDVFGSWTDGF